MAGNSSTAKENIAKSAGKVNRRWFMQLARTLGSLQLALVAGTIFTVAMIIGTVLESWYSAAIAQELIYYSWWFLLLLALLALCIFFATVKKWPWKKHQTGFLITHAGLLTMLAGGVLNSIDGVDGTMQLLDNKELSQKLRIDNRSGQVFLTQNHVMTIHRTIVDKDGLRTKKYKEYPINTGPLPWGTELGKDIPIPWGIKALSFLANPFPRNLNVKPFDDLQLEVLGFLPHVRIEQIEAAKEKEFGFPAIKLELNLRQTGHNQPRWMSLVQDASLDMPPWFGSAELGIWVEFIGKCDKALIEEFLSPPDDTSRGKMGELVFALSGKTYRLPVEQNLNKETALGDSGWKVSLKSYSPRMSKAEPGDPPEMPMVRAKVISPEGKSTNYAIASRLVMYPGPLDSFETPVDELPEGLPAVWYHPPDLRYSYNGQYSGRPHMKSVLQFVQSTDNRLFYRSLQEQGDKLQIESAGMAPPSGVSRNVWEKYAGSFLIEEHLPHAKPCLQRIIPLAKRPGLFSEETPPAVLGRLTLSKKTADGEIKKYTAERWFDLGRTQRLTISGTHDGTSFNEPLEVSYSYRTLQLPFEIELIRAESLVDPGTNSPATYSSFVKLYDAERNIHGEDHHITMNEPLNHRGFKIYQSQFSNAGLDPETMEPIARSGFTVGRDPGLWLKYLGTAMLGIGIATMYYMRAYNPRNLLRVISLSTQ